MKYLPVWSPIESWFRCFKTIASNSASLLSNLAESGALLIAYNFTEWDGPGCQVSGALGRRAVKRLECFLHRV
jgi:hypothetical protein